MAGAPSGRHAGGVALERVAVLVIGLLHLLVEVLGERRLEDD